MGSATAKRITFQVADVHKPLLSITACADMGFDCFVGLEGGMLWNRHTHEVIPLDRKGILYTMKMRVRQDTSMNIGQTLSGRVSDCGNQWCEIRKTVIFNRW